MPSHRDMDMGQSWGHQGCPQSRCHPCHPHSIPGSAVCAFYLADVERAFEGHFAEPRGAGGAWPPVPEERVPRPRYSSPCWVPGVRTRTLSPCWLCHRPGCCAGMGSATAIVTSGDFPDETLAFAKEHPLLHGAVAPAGGRPLFTRTGTRCPGTGRVGLGTRGGGHCARCRGKGAPGPAGAVGWGGCSCKRARGPGVQVCEMLGEGTRQRARACKTLVGGQARLVQGCVSPPQCGGIRGHGVRACKGLHGPTRGFCVAQADPAGGGCGRGATGEPHRALPGCRGRAGAEGPGSHA